MKLFDLEPDRQMAPVIGLLHGAVRYNFHRLKRLVQDLTQAEIDDRGPQGRENSIAQLLRHLAVVDLHWAYRLQSAAVPSEWTEKFGPMYDEQGRLPAVSGISLETLLEEYEGVQLQLRDVCLRLKDEDLCRQMPFENGNKATVRWGTWHIADHSRHHYSAIVQIKKRLRSIPEPLPPSLRMQPEPLQLSTARLTLRDFVSDDWPNVHAYASDPSVTRHMIWGPNGESETRAFIDLAIRTQQLQQPRIDFELAVIERTSGKLIGGCGIHVTGPSQGEIGYCFHPQYWGKGYASEAARALLAFGFRKLGLRRVYATCRPENLGSARVMQKIGMTLEGRLRSHMHHKGKWHDSFQYSILREEFEAGNRTEDSLR